MHKLEEKYCWLNSKTSAFVSRKHEDDKVIVFEIDNLVFLFNFHPSKSFPDYRVGVDHPGVYEIVLNSDDTKFGGHGRLKLDSLFFSEEFPFDKKFRSIQVYLPSRTSVVLSVRK